MVKITNMEFHEIKHEFDWNWKIISFSTWKLAPQADWSIVVKFGDNVLLFTAVINKNPDPDKDFVPLMVDWRESYSSAWKIWWSAFHKREWRPSTDAILYARLTDRALRPIFPKWMVNDVVISVTPLSIDKEQDLWMMSIVWSSLAVMAWWIPFNWPVWAVRIWYIDWNYIINPSREELEKSILNLIVAWPKWLINMIEVDWKEVSDDIINKAFEIWQQEINKIIDQQQEYLSKLAIQSKEIVITKPSEDLLKKVSEIIWKDWFENMFWKTKSEFNNLYYQYEDKVLEVLKDQIEDESNEEITETKVKIAVFNSVKKEIRNRTLSTWIRLDNRDFDTIRPLYCEVWLMPRTHWTWLFWRWDTQVLTTVTLWATSEYQVVDTMEFDDKEERYIHHYNFPPFSNNEAKWTRWPWRREIWHWALAEKALVHVIPDKEQFPYTIRAVSECLASGWSTSQASVCASTLALMDAWVPIKAPVAWIAMWLMTEHDQTWNITKYAVLTDLSWTEDFIGDMDFKVAGTRSWITAIQLDTKIPWLTFDIIKETIQKAHDARNAILDFMLNVIPEPRKQLSPYAPKVYTMKIDPSKIREVIGRWWEVIDKLIEKAWWVKIDFEEDWTVYITDQSEENIQKAVKLIEEIVKDLPLNTPLDWKITRIEKYWLFVALPGWKLWLVGSRTLWIMGDLNRHFKVWQDIKVEISSIDDKWRLVLKKV